MLKRSSQFLFALISLSFIIGCANRGTPSGGEKDVTPPEIIRSTPENFTTNFTGDEIRIYFDEYIKVKDLQKQLIISPPMDPEPDIIPLGTASKYIRIKIKDTLLPNTTYAFNFGQSIVDNNEENPYPYYRYVFSTGETIDSLSVSGQVMDASNRVTDKFISVMLYEVDSTFTDSIVYKEKPKYVTNTLDSTTVFSIDNIKSGKYMLVALKEESGNFTFQPKTDKIGFHKEFIEVPTDSTYLIKLFQEELDFKALRPRQVAGQKIAFGYEGNYKGTTIDMLDSKPEGSEIRITKDKDVDTLYYWYKPKVELDSTLFRITNNTHVDTLKHRFRDLEKDSLTLSSEPRGTLKFDDDFTITGSVPFAKIDKSYITIIDKDSLAVDYQTELDTLFNTYKFKFDKKEDETYKVQLLPNALTDFFGNVNDTLNYTLRTKDFTQYSDIRLRLINAKYPVIVQLVDDTNKVFYEQYVTENKPVDFEHIAPKDYYIRVIFDENENGKWDSGNYLKGIQPERISFYPEKVEARANWINQPEFTLD
ncbi:Ig-like domain-containing protein [Winogradskyella sp. 3972H.M.0a.05]|uniref:Ig-like domain-containing protein n=1 Tax=Winogradskyella sp. 3972H.M.0a.05 TaxID=2950277 RepID=UPI0033922125